MNTVYCSSSRLWSVSSGRVQIHSPVSILSFSSFLLFSSLPSLATAFLIPSSLISCGFDVALPVSYFQSLFVKIPQHKSSTRTSLDLSFTNSAHEQYCISAIAGAPIPSCLSFNFGCSSFQRNVPQLWEGPALWYLLWWLLEYCFGSWVMRWPISIFSHAMAVKSDFIDFNIPPILYFEVIHIDRLCDLRQLQKIH